MQVPLQIVFEHVSHSDALEAAIRKEALRLERFYDRITLAACVPGGKPIDIARDPAATGRHEDAHVTIRDAFDAAGRRLQDHVRKLGGAIKSHEAPPHGTIASLAPESDHGFIAASDGREIYFHRNTVDGVKLEELELGQEVRFAESVGDKGPQATFVKPIGKHHIA